VAEPAFEYWDVDLGVELHAPRAFSQPVGLEANRARGERYGSGWELERVAVPLQRLEALGKPAEDRIASRLGCERHLVPADLLLRSGPDPRAGGLGEELASQAHAEGRDLRGEESLEQPVFFAKPRMSFLLVDMHGTAEEEHGVERLRIIRRRAVRRRPLQELPAPVADGVAEDAARGIRLMEEREDSHRGSLGKRRGLQLVMCSVSVKENRCRNRRPSD
jgi:hypothetical protein